MTFSEEDVRKAREEVSGASAKELESIACAWIFITNKFIENDFEGVSEDVIELLTLLEESMRVWYDHGA